MKQQQEHQLDPKNPQENHRQQTGRAVFRGGGGLLSTLVLKIPLMKSTIPRGGGEGGSNQ